MQSPSFEWPPLESSPEIFTDYMRRLGLPSDYHFSECLGLDSELLGMITHPVEAVIINFESLAAQERKELLSGDVPFFMKQTPALDNACGIIACLHAVYNLRIPVDSGSILAKYQEATRSQSPEEKAAALEKMQEFKDAHSEFAELVISNVQIHIKGQSEQA